jgi:V-type H+-transporting ATPase subunit H
MAAYAEDVSELTTTAVLKREIPWESFLTARLISDKELVLIRKYDKRPADVQADLLAEVRPLII